MKVDILFLAKNRREYTEEALKQLERSTNWDLVDRLILVNDEEQGGISQLFLDYLKTHSKRKIVFCPPCNPPFGSPVAVTNHFLSIPPFVAPWFAKIDNDTIVPPGWLDVCVAVAETDNVDLIGIEARYCENPPMVAEDTSVIRYRRTDHVGGIGLFRRKVFETHPLPQPNGYYGFTEWQWQHTDIRKCWIDPPLPVFLLDHLPLEPWRSLGQEYMSKGWQRESWGEYDAVKDRGLWEWWLSAAKTV